MSTDLPIQEVLRTLGFQKIRPYSRGYMALCRFHDNKKTAAFCIGPNGLWRCWSCGERGNLRQLHERLGDSTTKDWRFALKMVGMNMSGRNRIAAPKKRLGLPEDFTEYSFWDEVPSVVKKRVKWDTVKKFHLGSCHKPGVNAGRCIIPIYYKSSIVGYHGRALSDKQQPRYYNPSGFDIKDYVFNYDSCKIGGEVIVVEGAFKAMAMWEKGFPNTIATFGTQFKPAQVMKISSLAPSSVVICFDRDSNPDHPGQKAAMKLGSILSELMDVRIMPMPFDKDPNDLPEDILRICYSKMIPFEKLAR